MARFPGSEPLHRSILALGRRFLLVRSAAGPVGRPHVVDFRRKTGGQICAQLLLFPLVLLCQSPMVRLGQALPTLLPDFTDHPQEDLFWRARPGSSVSDRASNISAGNIRSAIDGEGNTVGEFAAPA